MKNGSFFDFEEKNRDFPFYNQNNLSTQKNMMILALTVVIFSLLILGPVKFFDGQEQIILFLFTVFMLLYLTKCNLGLFFRKLELKDLRTVIIYYILFYVYYLAVLGLFNFINYQTTSSIQSNYDTLMLLVNFLQIIAEEIFKVSLFLLVLHYSFRYMGDRKKAIVIAATVSLAVFGLMHINSYPNIPQILLLQGFGSFSELCPYIKTKNLTLSVLVHTLINFSMWIPKLFV